MGWAVACFLLGWLLRGGFMRGPDWLVCWHRACFRIFWRWRCRKPGGRPRISAELRELIRGMSIENPLWGAPRIHGELLKLGFRVAQSTVARYMARRPRGGGQSWKTFLQNHSDAIAAIDMLVVPTLGLGQLYAFIVLGLRRRKILHVEVTDRP